ncbi:hypothetical protein VNI00_013351 [Paramarasmius palmivorus]|uniref:Uncharacterized protein n=1 Tax=Paramarasmius palmivorus TaxID=297713 RepID=A0AAW0BYF7_9AGAR
MQLLASLSMVFVSILAVAATEERAAPVAHLMIRRDECNTPKIACKDPESLPSDCLCNKIEGTFCGNETINPACTNYKQFECHTDGSTCLLGLSGLCAPQAPPCQDQYGGCSY